MLYKDKKIKSVGELIKHLKSDVRDGRPIWYRGHINQEWKLLPSLARKTEYLKAEAMLIKKFIQTASPHLAGDLPKNQWSWIFLMQHHRLPTRLLDWSENPLVGLYFSLWEDPQLPVDKKKKTKDAALWCLDPLKLNKEARYNFKFELELPAFGVDDMLNSYLPERLGDSTSELFPVAAIGQRNSKRMIAQAGTFTINHANVFPIEDIGEKKHVWRYIIPHDCKGAIQKELELLGIVDLAIFPELDSAASKIKKELLNG